MAGVDAWPHVTYETREWTSTIDRDLLSRRQRETYASQYAAAIPAMIADADLQLNGSAAADADDASAELVRFDAEIGAISAPFASILLRSESASSQIEHLTSGARAIAEAELAERDRGNASLIVRNVRAMTAALSLTDTIDDDSIIAMQHALLGEHNPEITKRYRDQQVWIGGGSIGPHEASFVPPHADRVPAAMADLLAYVARNDIPVLAQAAIAHAQFETIHPFPDGNGRTGRALVQAMLRQKDLTRSVTVPVSAGLLSDVDEYFDALSAYREGDVQPIVGAFATAALRAVANGRILAAEINRIRSSWESKLAGLRSDAAARRIVTLALEQPVLNRVVVVERLGIATSAAYNALESLASRGVIRTTNSHRRNRIWIADDVVTALDDFAARAGDRRLR